MGELDSDLHEEIKLVAHYLQTFRHRVVLTGAGISTPSGVPDFRSAGSGLWEKYDPYTVASLRAFRYDPEKFYAWLRPLARTIHDASPNPAHFALARLEAQGYLETIITQNIDGLHQRAGSRQVLEIHGSMRTLTCVSCYQTFDSSDFIPPYLEYGEIPICPVCHNTLKPDIILFEEQMPVMTWQSAEAACKKCDCILVIGSSLEVVPAAQLPLQAVDHGAQFVIINRTNTYLDRRAQVVLRGDAAEILPWIAIEVIGD
jgi:NAD-dependent deacetylase